MSQFLNRSHGSVFINEAQNNPLQPDVQWPHTATAGPPRCGQPLSTCGIVAPPRIRNIQNVDRVPVVPAIELIIAEAVLGLPKGPL